MIYRSNINGIICEICPAKKPLGNIVVCEGLPCVPQRKIFLQQLADEGYNVFYPRYEGTWESAGTFLNHPPSQDIARIIKAISTESILNINTKQRFDFSSWPINIIGGSFGGFVSLNILHMPEIKKAVIISPMIKPSVMDTGLRDFIKKAFGEGYRFKNNDWKAFSSQGEFNQDLSAADITKTLILYGKNDKTIPPEDIVKFSKKYEFSAEEIPEAGHISFSKIDQSLLRKILNWLR